MKTNYLLAGAVAIGLLATGAARAGTEQVIHDFQGGTTDGSDARGGLVAIGGVLYGTTRTGGASGGGTVFAVTAQGSEHLLHSFTGGTDGVGPVAGLTVVGRDLYGTTFQNDISVPGFGTAFSTTISGAEATVAQFTQRSGIHPVGRLVQVKGGLYGLALSGGVGGVKTTFGTLYKFGAKGTPRAVYTFRGGIDGREPFGDLLLKDGAFYGATMLGGTASHREGSGTIFKVTPDGQEAVLHAFNGTDGAQPNGGLVDVGGTLYGTTAGGGANGLGTVFKLAADGTFTSIHSFQSSGDGREPIGDLVDVGGTLYGTTRIGGAHDRGTIFTVTPGADTVSVVYSFPCCGKGHGAYPSAGLTPLNGALYGTTAGGGAANNGTVFRYRP